MLRLVVKGERQHVLQSRSPRFGSFISERRGNSHHQMAKKRRRTTWSSSRISRFSQSLLREWKRLDLPGVNSTVVVAVSGGADSVAVLLALDELVSSNKLSLKLLIAHLHHRLRGKASDA